MENTDKQVEDKSALEVKTTPETKIPEVKGHFSLNKMGPYVTMYNLHKKSKKGAKALLNHSDKPLEFDGEKLPVATQAILKQVYDSDPSYTRIITAPEGYKAPWAE